MMRTRNSIFSHTRFIASGVCSILLLLAVTINSGCTKTSDDTVDPSTAATTDVDTDQEQVTKMDSPESESTKPTESPAPIHQSSAEVNDTADPFLMKKANKEIVAARELIMEKGGFTPEIVAGLAELHRLYPQHGPTTELYGRSLEKMQRWGDLADLMLEKPADKRPVAESIKLTKALISLQRYDEAADVIMTVVEKRPDNLDAVKLAATATFYASRYEQTATLIDENWDQLVADRWYELLHLRGAAYIKAGDQDKGIELLREIIKLVPEHSMAHEALGNVLLQRGEQEQGQQHIDTAEKLRANFTHPELTELHIAVIGRAAATAAREQKYDECFGYIDELFPLVKGKSLAELYQLRAQILQAQGKTQQAAQSAAQAQQIIQKLEAAAEESSAK